MIQDGDHILPPPSRLWMRGLRSALKGPFSLELDAGRCTVLSGPSGVGKSLFLRMIADLDPSEGSIGLDDVDRAAIPAPRWRRMVTYVAAAPGWWLPTLRDHLAADFDAKASMDDLDLRTDLLDAPLDRMSTGERQRAGLIRALSVRPRFLLLDEPTSALDASSALRLEDVIRAQATTGLGILFVSHDPGQVERIADRHLVMTSSCIREATT